MFYEEHAVLVKIFKPMKSKILALWYVFCPMILIH